MAGLDSALRDLGSIPSFAVSLAGLLGDQHLICLPVSLPINSRVIHAANGPWVSDAGRIRNREVVGVPSSKKQLSSRYVLNEAVH